MEQSFETSLKRLEEIAELMNDPACGIKNLVDYYKEAVELTARLNETLLRYELQVTELMKTARGIAEGEFDVE